MLGALKRLVRRTVTGLSEVDARLLRDLSLHRTDPAFVVAARLGLAPEAVVEAAGGLEHRGLLRLSRDQGSAHNRILAVTKAGRKAVRSMTSPSKMQPSRNLLTAFSPLAALRSRLPRFRV